MKRIIYVLLLLSVAVFTSNAVYAQAKFTASGTVTDENNEPLIGVSVVQAGTTKSVATDIDGKFTITVDQGAQLTFSYLGYLSETVTAQASTTIQLTPTSKRLDEVTVVSIGYGTARKADLTGAITSVQAKDLRQGVINNPSQMLQGKVAGLMVVKQGGDPNGGVSVRLRGGTSLNAGNNPLWVIDGVANADIRSVQPNEIVSMDVLKDASAAAIYGSRGANGVILVTTNRERQGGGSVQYNGFASFGFAKLVDVLSANEWRAQLQKYDEAGAPIANAVGYGGSTDWQKEVTRLSVSHSHNVSYAMNGAHNGMRGSFTYLDSQGVVKYSDMKRLLGNLSGYQYGLNNKLKVELSLNVRADKGRNHGMPEVTFNNPTIPIRDANGELIRWLPSATGGSPWENPLYAQERDKDNSEYTDKSVLGYFKAELEIIKGLKAMANGSYEYRNNVGASFSPSVTGWDEVVSKNSAGRSYSETLISQIETYLSYEKEIAKHRFGVMAGYSYEESVNQGFSASSADFETNDFKWNNIGSGDKTKFEVGSSKSESKLISFFGRANYTYNDRYMFTGTYRRDGSSKFGVNNKWGDFLSGSVAWRISEEEFMESVKDYISNLKLRIGYGVTGNEGIGSYKSIMTMGTSEAGRYYDAANDEWKYSYKVNQNPNPDLKWESTAQTNIGLDFSLFNKFNVTVEWYRKLTSDLLYNYEVPVPPYLFPTMDANVGDLSNTGFEFTLGADVINTKDFNFGFDLTASTNKMVVEKMSNETFKVDVVQKGRLNGTQGLDMGSNGSQRLQEGSPVGTFYGPKCDGIAQENIDVYNPETGAYMYTIEKGEFLIPRTNTGSYIAHSDASKWEELGSAQPDVILGLSLHGAWRDFDFSVTGYGMFGQQLLNRFLLQNQSTGVAMNGGRNVTRTWTEYGFSNTSDKMKVPQYSSFWIENSSYFRIQNVILGYTLPQKWSKAIGISKLRIYAMGENLLTFTGYTGLDPEVSIDSIEPGIDYGGYPTPRIVSVGLNVSF